MVSVAPTPPRAVAVSPTHAPQIDAGAPDAGIPEARTSAAIDLHQTGAELIRYFAASALALAVDFGLLVVLTEAVGLHYQVSGALAFVCGAAVIYLLSIRWVFATRRMAGRPSAELAIFVAIGVVGLGLNHVMLGLGTEDLGLPYEVSKIGSVGAVFTWNFIARKLTLFTRPQPSASVH